MTPELHWSDDADGARSLFVGNLPYPIAIGHRRRSGMWRYDLGLPGAEHVSLASRRELAEGMMETWAAAWFAAVTA